MLAGDGDDLLEEFQLDALCSGVGREVQHQHFRPRPGVLDGLFQFSEEVHARQQRHMADIGAGDDAAIGMNRVGRVWHQHCIARTEGRQRQMRQAFLGTDGDDGLGLGVEIYGVAGLVPVADGAARRRGMPRDTE